MFKNRIPEHQADPPAGARRREFEERILAAIAKAERAHKLPRLSANSKSLLFLRLKELREELGFIDGAHLRWQDLPEKRQQAAQSWLVYGEEGLHDRRTGGAISNEQELHDVIYGLEKADPAGDSKPEIPRQREHAVETIDSTGRAETVQLLIGSPSTRRGAFQEIADAFFTPWSNTPNPRYEEFSAWIELLRSMVIAECRAEWRGRRLAVTSPEAAEAEFGGLPPLWFDYFPLRDTDGLKGETAVWIKRAREWELGRRTEAAAEAVFVEPAAVPQAPAPAAPVAVELPKAELQTLTEETVPDGPPISPQITPAPRKSALAEWMQQQIDALGLDSPYPQIRRIRGLRKDAIDRVLNDRRHQDKTTLKLFGAVVLLRAEEKLSALSEDDIPDVPERANLLKVLQRHK